MAHGKKSFVLYADMLQCIEHLTNEEKGILFNHLLQYVNDMKPVLTDRLLLTAWKPIELSLKRDLAKFEEVKKKRSNAGKRSAELRAKEHVQQASTNPTHVESVQQNTTHVESVEQSSTNPTDNVNDNDNVNVILLKKETKYNLGEFSISEETETPKTEKKQKEKSCAKKEKENKPDLSEFLAYAEQIIIENKLGDLNAYKLAIEAKYEQWSNNDWKDGHGKPIKRWRPKLKTAFQYFKPIKQYNHGNTQQISTSSKLAAEDARKAGIVEMLKRNSQIINGDPGTQPNDGVGHSEENTGYAPYVIVEENRGTGGSTCGNKLTDSGGGSSA